MADGKRDEARELWLTIARTRGLESRHALQAWTLLRRDGVLPDGAEATVVHAVVCEVPVAGGHDLLAVYGDGSVRYLNHSGAAVVHEPGTSAVTDEAAAAVHAAAEPLGEIVGLWDEPELPALPPGHARLLLLTPGGFRFGQGPSESLWHDPSAGPVLQAATHLLVLVTAP